MEYEPTFEAGPNAGTMEYEVVVPQGCAEGSELLVEACGESFVVTVPPGLCNGDSFVALLPTNPAAQGTLDVIVPEGCFAGDSFVVYSEHGEYRACVPHGCVPGSVVSVSIPPMSNAVDLGSCESKAMCDEAPAAEELSGSSSDGSGDAEERACAPKFPVGLPAEVLRTDGLWTLATVIDYDPRADNYTVQLADGRCMPSHPSCSRVPNTARGLAHVITHRMTAVCTFLPDASQNAPIDSRLCRQALGRHRTSR